MGKLEKAKLISRDPELTLTVPCIFNPKELSVEKQVSWKPQAGAFTDEPPEEFAKPQPATLSVTLHYDTYETKQSVSKEYTDNLMKLARIISTSIKRPPLCAFSWGNFVFQGVISSLSIKYTMFLSSGTPVRAECTLKMIQASQSVTGSGSGADS